MKFRSLIGLVPIVFILLLWQLLPQLRIVDPVFLPPISSILYLVFESIATKGIGSTLLVNFEFTVERAILGFLIASVIGIPLGIAIGSSKSVKRLAEPTIEIFRPLPPVVLIPFFILVFGIDQSMYLAFIAFGAIWPILVNSIDGSRGVEPLMLDVARVLKINRLGRFFKIRLPASSPFIVSGMRVGLLLSLLVAVAIEMVAGHNGLGYLVIYAQEESDVKTLYAVIILMAVTGYIFNLLFVRTENYFVRWHKIFRKGITAAVEA
ncbi:MAG: ABC transporter permease [Nitrososphaerota archaeon]|nr:ABC transporter permease [Nitrososphaerota archaeon]